MKNKKITIISLLALALVLLTGMFLVVFLNIANAGEEVSAEEQIDVTMFSAYTDVEVFQDVPAMIVEGATIDKAAESGGHYYLIGVNGTSEKDYEDYLVVLEEYGFKKHSDNGPDKMDGYARTASYTKENLTLTVSQSITLEKTFISAAFDQPLSDHLVYKDEYVADNMEGAQTKMYLVELYYFGNSYVIQLKNGHFVVHDGGWKDDAKYLLDFLDSLAPEGEKPVVEAWFVSHAHSDHNGALLTIATDFKLKDRVYVEGVYYTEPSAYVVQQSKVGQTGVYLTETAAKVFDNGKGGKSQFYRPQFGQRYYFCDITIDVTLTPEQVSDASYYTYDFNDTSIWLMHHIEGQTFMLAGDASHTTNRLAMNMFDKSYFDVDMYSVLHHGVNTYDYFVDFVETKTLLYTNWRAGSLYMDGPELLHARTNEHASMQEKATEICHYGNGTVVFTFPYKLGSYETLPKNEWVYHNGQPNRYFDISSASPAN